MEHDGKQIYPASITGKGSSFARGGSVLDHAFGKGDPYTLGVEEEYMLLDAETFDLVQHIDTVLAAVTRTRARAAHQRGADAVGARDRDARVQDTCRRRRAAEEDSRLRLRDCARRGPPRRRRRNPSVQPLRAAANHGERPVPKPRRPAAVRGSTRTDLRHARPRRGRRSGEGNSGRERPAQPPRSTARAVRVLAVLARRADGPVLV